MFELIGQGHKIMHESQAKNSQASRLEKAHQAATDKRTFWPGHWTMAALIERKKRQEANPAKGKKA